MDDFKHALGDQVGLNGSAEEGEVIAIALHREGSVRQYLVRYLAGDGLLTEAWWSESALRAA